MFVLWCGQEEKRYIYLFFGKVGERKSHNIYINQSRSKKKNDKNKVLRAEKLEHLLIHLDDRYVALQILLLKLFWVRVDRVYLYFIIYVFIKRILPNYYVFGYLWELYRGYYYLQHISITYNVGVILFQMSCFLRYMKLKGKNC